jgi:hypothetical protein
MKGRPSWQHEIWSCYYCGSYNENHLYYCTHCNAKRREDRRLYRQDPMDWSNEYAGMPYYPGKMLSALVRSDLEAAGSIRVGSHRIEILESSFVPPGSWCLRNISD